ncbi:MAG: hypothetical protein AB7O97_02450 [Planctomycetota bacterium]
MSVRRWLLPAASLLAVVGITAWEFATARTGPGPLHPAHAGLDGMFGSDCQACHEAGAGVRAEGCIACHEPIAAQRRDVTGLHGSLPRAQLDDCGQCHSEHHGLATPLIGPQAFPGAGVHDPLAYDHRHVAGYALGGAHLALECDRCHPAANVAVPPAGGRFLGASQRCTACHEDVHVTAFGGDCEKCHGQVQSFRTAPGFDHAVFPLLGAHSRVGCQDCHEPGSAHDTAALSRAPLPARTCAQCHDDPHGNTRGRPVAAIRLPDTADCARCHDSTQWSAARVTPQRHAEFGFPLRGAHAAAECVTCHGDATRPSRHGTPKAAVESCARCHEQPHAARFVQSAVAAIGPADGCAGCHSDADRDFHRGTTTPAQHAVTGFRLDPPHARVECAKCHAGDGYAARFPGRAPDDCRACHDDRHRGQFDHEGRYAQCTACHARTAFAPNAFGVAMHRDTAFPLTGAHDAVACARCHDRVVDDVRTFHGTPQKCAECHDDVHKGAFDVVGKPALVQGRQGCARCHDTAAFTPVRATTFDHGLWTGYALDGAHATVECLQCHVPTAEDRDRRLGRVAGKQCADCHRDQHQGQFTVAGVNDCTRCHDTADFHRPHFDHDRQSRFPLDAQHAPLACDACHKAYPSVAGPVVRYKPLGTECGDCHRLGAGGEVRK